VLRWLTERRRRHLLETPFPDAWRATLDRNVAAVRRLDDAQRRRLHELVQVFVAEKHWEGCGGLEMTDEVRVTIAGCACLMLLARDHDLFAEVQSILVYPTAVVGPTRLDLGWLARTPIPQRNVVAGESHHHGPVILAWDAVLAGAAAADDGRNVVIHEFAHKIDDLDGATDGTPPLPRAALRAWVEACATAFLAHRARLERGEPSFLRDYAAASEAEFFAVASEAYFEQPARFAAELPEVYAVLRDFYGWELTGDRAG
jgi:MtfA peptidase